MSTRPQAIFFASVATGLAAIATYVGDDYPELWDAPSPNFVAMTVQETHQYPIHGGHDALEMWATTNAKGFGYVRLGNEQRAFAVSMFHQLHCVRLMRAGLAGRYDAYARGHMQHCLNYIRQMILCSPDLTLEPPDVLTRDFELDRVGATHICSDWESMYTEAASNFGRWYRPANSTSQT
ncbi:hypothetical protein C8R46DRAFT_1166192 [Mycena filopes]|nr:hypothetical protein C8R46DRAFT_1166192 [Mycena filopes]